MLKGPSTESISIDIDKASAYEELSLVRASMEEAENRTLSEKASAAISNERICEGNELLDTYQVTSHAIKGGMGSVWRVYHKKWNVDLAMKRPRPEFFAEGSRNRKERFIHECEAWINLGLHPNIVACYYVREIGGVPTIFSEWMDNGSLEDLIRNGTLYDCSDREIRERLLNIAIQFARGLHYAHETGGMIHQDVKPDNLLLSKDWEVKVSDFGLAAARSPGESSEGEGDGGRGQDAALAKAVTVPVGGMTKAYCSPEQADKCLLTIHTDIYSWAVSIMEMYLQGKPWEQKGKITGPKAGQLCREYLQTAKIPVPARMQDLLEWCMRPDPEDRPRDFAVIVKELLSIYTEITGEAFPVPEPEAASGTAASLNNRALSFLDLNHPAEAEASWKTALAADPGHVESLYNYALWRWRRGETDDADALHFLERGRDGILKDRLKTRLELERGNRDGVTENADEEDRLFAAHLHPLDLNSIRLPRIMKQTPLLKISPDDELILCGEKGAVLYSTAERCEKWMDPDLCLSDESVVNWVHHTDAPGKAGCDNTGGSRPDSAADNTSGSKNPLTIELKTGQLLNRTVLPCPVKDHEDSTKVIFRKDGGSAQICSITDSDTGYMAQRITQITIRNPAMQTLHTFSLPGWGLPPTACFTGEGDLLAVFVDRESCFFDPEKGEMLPYRLPGSCLAVAKMQEGKYYALRGGFQKIGFVDIQTGRCMRSVLLPGLIKIYSADIGRSMVSVCGPAGREADLLFYMRLPSFEYLAGWELSRVHDPSRQLKLERQFRSLLFYAENACKEKEYGKALDFIEQAMALDETLGRDRRAAALRRKILVHGTKTALLTVSLVQTVKAVSGKLWFSQDGTLLLIKGKGSSRTLNLETGEMTGGIEKEYRLPDQSGKPDSTYWIRASEGSTAAFSRVLRSDGYRYEVLLEYKQSTGNDAEGDDLRLRGAYIETDGRLIDPGKGKKSEWTADLGHGYYYDNELRFLSDHRTLLLMRDLRSEASGRRLCCMFFDMRDGSILREWTIPLSADALFSSLRFSPDDSYALMKRQTDLRDETGFFRYTLTDFEEITMADGTLREPLSQKPQRLHGKNHSIISNDLRYTGIGDQILYIREPGVVALTQLNRREKELEIRGDFGIPADMAISPDGAFLAVAGGEGSGEIFVYQLEWERHFDSAVTAAK